MPTRKWWAATVIGIAGLIVLYIQVGEWTTEVTITVVTFLSQRIVSYLVPNEETPGGVPARR